MRLQQRRVGQCRDSANGAQVRRTDHICFATKAGRLPYAPPPEPPLFPGPPVAPERMASASSIASAVSSGSTLPVDRYGMSPYCASRKIIGTPRLAANQSKSVRLRRYFRADPLAADHSHLDFGADSHADFLPKCIRAPAPCQPPGRRGFPRAATSGDFIKTPEKTGAAADRSRTGAVLPDGDVMLSPPGRCRRVRLLRMLHLRTARRQFPCRPRWGGGRSKQLAKRIAQLPAATRDRPFAGRAAAEIRGR